VGERTGEGPPKCLKCVDAPVYTVVNGNAYRADDTAQPIARAHSVHLISK